MIVAIVMVIVYSSTIKKMGLYQWLVLLLLFSIVVGIHGVSHLGLEKEYGYNPIVQVLGE
jgi:hypothetical protein